MSAYTYTGKQGEHYMGIPAHDLSDDDVAQLTDEQRDLLDASAFYEPVAASRAAKQAAPKSASAAASDDKPAEPSVLEGIFSGSADTAKPAEVAKAK